MLKYPAASQTELRITYAKFIKLKIEIVELI